MYQPSETPHPVGTSPIRTDPTLKQIDKILDSSEWSADTIDQIADVLRRAGHEINDINESPLNRGWAQQLDDPNSPLSRYNDANHGKNCKKCGKSLGTASGGAITLPNGDKMCPGCASQKQESSADAISLGTSQNWTTATTPQQKALNNHTSGTYDDGVARKPKLKDSKLPKFGDMKLPTEGFGPPKRSNDRPFDTSGKPLGKQPSMDPGPDDDRKCSIGCGSPANPISGMCRDCEREFGTRR
jgi:hypothetical protein